MDDTLYENSNNNLQLIVILSDRFRLPVPTGLGISCVVTLGNLVSFSVTSVD
jgi:hypothetical protein